MRKYSVYVNSGRLYFTTQERAMKYIKDLMAMNLGGDFKCEEIEENDN